jgi:hypothetical protein
MSDHYGRRTSPYVLKLNAEGLWEVPRTRWTPKGITYVTDKQIEAELIETSQGKGR